MRVIAVTPFHSIKTIIIKLTLLMLSFITPFTEANERTIIVGINHYPPHLNAKDKKITGPAKNYISEIVQQAGYKTRFVRSPRKRLLQQLNSGDIDLAFPVLVDDNERLNYISAEPMSYEIPGLCFKKKDHIPFLSLQERWRQLKVIYPGGMELIPILKKYNENLTELMGDQAIERSIGLVILGRAEAAYTPNVNAIYHIGSKYYADIACSNFYGNTTPVYLASSKNLNTTIFAQIKKAYRQHHKYRGLSRP